MQKYNSIELETANTSPNNLYNIIDILLKNSYSLIVRQEIPEYIIIEFNGSPEFGYPQPHWISEDEQLLLTPEE